MDKEWLTDELAAGRSIEPIAREAGKHPSTVAYWVKKHGLESVHADKHRAKGGLTREQLELLIDRGLSTRGIAEELDVSLATVRHWLGRHGLQTLRGDELRAQRISLERLEDGDAMAICPRHGWTRFRSRGPDQGWRCLECRMEYVVDRRRRLKALLVAEAGGACVLCGYHRSLAALQFHHCDRKTKAFNMSQNGVWRSLEAAREEAKKCVLLCATCHAEVEVGVATIPPESM